MEFCSACFFGYLKNVAWVNAASWHDDNASVGLFYQFLEHRDACYSIGFQAGCQYAGTTQFNDLFQCFFRVAAHVECTMEGYVHVAYGIHQFLHSRNVYITFGSQTAEYYTIGTQLAGYLDVVKHDFLF